MNDSRLEWKVGLFVAAGLALLAALVLNFSKGVTLFKSTYELKIILPTVAGLKPTADIMMAGVPVGKVQSAELDPEGRSVTIDARVLSKFHVRHDAKFHIDELGFLGDQYIEITPPLHPSTPPVYLTNGETVLGDAPFNMQEAVRSTAGLLDQAKQTMTDLDAAVTNINRTVLSQATLADFTLSLSNIEALSETASSVVNGARQMLSTNTVPLHAVVTNAELASEKLNLIADNFNGIIVSNRDLVAEILQNFRDTSATLKQLAQDAQAGRGTVGGLLEDETMKAQIASFVSNANLTSQQLSLFSSNLNQRGVWAMLWKPKEPGETTNKAARAPHESEGP